jgi:DNA processing protein
MDDKTPVDEPSRVARTSAQEFRQTPDSTWLSFALTFAHSTRLCRHIRQAHPDPAAAGTLIQRFLTRDDDELRRILQGLVSAEELAGLFSDTTARLCDQALTWQAGHPDHHLMGLDHRAYPQLLQDTDDAPPLLYAHGSLAALQHPLLAVVGSRKASHAALAHARSLSTELASAGLGIVSGLALGIDAAAHEGALAAVGPLAGPTLAVAATAPDRVYPRRHAALAGRIVDEGGLIVTEYPLGSTPRPWYFPQRNRIISGLSLGVLVAEAGLPSGTLTTATHAINQGREVMAIPGSVHNLQARGCHALIKQGAALVEDARDVMDVLGEPLQRALASLCRGQGSRQDVAHARVQRGRLADSDPACTSAITAASPALAGPGLSQAEQRLLDVLASQNATIDELMTQTPFSVSQLASMLGLLEIKGLITTTAGGRYARC